MIHIKKVIETSSKYQEWIGRKNILDFSEEERIFIMFILGFKGVKDINYAIELYKNMQLGKVQMHFETKGRKHKKIKTKI
jgi:hypothetical protein